MLTPNSTITAAAATDAPPLLVAGAAGTLGRAFQLVCRIRGLRTVCLGRLELDITNADSIGQAVRRYRPWALVNTAGYVRVDAAETDAARCFRENTLGPLLLARACAAQNLPLLTFSSDLVFDGWQNRPYLETDPGRPLNVYGHSKLQAEQAVLSRHPRALVVRTSAFFGAWDEHNFVHHALSAARQNRPFAAANDLLVSPTYVPDLVNTALDLLLDAEHGRWHLANAGGCTWAELAQLALRTAGLDPALVQPQPAASFGWPAARPGFSVLGSQRGQLLPSFESGLHRYLADEQLLHSERPPAYMHEAHDA